MLRLPNIFRQPRVLNGLYSAVLTTMASQDLGLPYFAKGKIVPGFGRGSKDLGFPTANFPTDVTENLPNSIGCGIYCGWASVDDGEVYKMVMSIGYNPFYKNTHKTMETYVLHSFNRDLHGCLLKVCIVRYLRPEMNFNSLDDLIKAIKGDVSQAERELEKPDCKVYQSDRYFLPESRPHVERS